MSANKIETTGSLEPIWQCMVAGLIGGGVGDSSMHSLDTVKTRQQAAPNVLQYRSTFQAYKTIFIKEGFRKGLYSGYLPAMLGSLPSGAIFFGSYEFVKRKLINEYKLNETFSYLTAGFIGDLNTSFIYVPTEVLKTRLQLQGQYNNPYFKSGYNYKGLYDAIRTIYKSEGISAFYFGYKATLYRDLPFSAIQFAFYERFRSIAVGIEKSEDLTLFSEIITGGLAGGISGVITTPLDVYKTRVQTQASTALELGASSGASQNSINPGIPLVQKKNYLIPTTARPAILQTSSVFKGLYIVYQTEGVVGLFSGVQPRFIWTSIQSSVMLFLYQEVLKQCKQSDRSKVSFT